MTAYRGGILRGGTIDLLQPLRGGFILRKDSSDLKADAQPKAAPARAAKKLDDSLLTGKKPSADIDKRQQLATPGETIPIVFGKRVDDIGGIWVQPSMVKAGTKNLMIHC